MSGTKKFKEGECFVCVCMCLHVCLASYITTNFYGWLPDDDGWANNERGSLAVCVCVC